MASTSRYVGRIAWREHDHATDQPQWGNGTRGQGETYVSPGQGTLTRKTIEPAPIVIPVLGRLQVEGAKLTESKPANNNTRWILDVEGVVADKITIELINIRGKIIKPDLMSCAFLPRSESFYTARPYATGLDSGRLVLQHGDRSVPCCYRVQIDIMHSATR